MKRTRSQRSNVAFGDLTLQENQNPNLINEKQFENSQKLGFQFMMNQIRENAMKDRVKVGITLDDSSGDDLKSDETFQLFSFSDPDLSDINSGKTFTPAEQLAEWPVELGGTKEVESFDPANTVPVMAPANTVPFYNEMGQLNGIGIPPSSFLYSEGTTDTHIGNKSPLKTVRFEDMTIEPKSYPLEPEQQDQDEVLAVVAPSLLVPLLARDPSSQSQVIGSALMNESDINRMMQDLSRNDDVVVAKIARFDSPTADIANPFPENSVDVLFPCNTAPPIADEDLIDLWTELQSIKPAERIVSESPVPAVPQSTETETEVEESREMQKEETRTRSKSLELIEKKLVTISEEWAPTITHLADSITASINHRIARHEASDYSIVHLIDTIAKDRFENVHPASQVTTSKTIDTTGGTAGGVTHTEGSEVPLVQPTSAVEQPVTESRVMYPQEMLLEPEPQLTLSATENNAQHNSGQSQYTQVKPFTSQSKQEVFTPVPMSMAPQLPVVSVTNTLPSWTLQEPILVAPFQQPTMTPPELVATNNPVPDKVVVDVLAPPRPLQPKGIWAANAAAAAH